LHWKQVRPKNPEPVAIQMKILPSFFPISSGSHEDKRAVFYRQGIRIKTYKIPSKEKKAEFVTSSAISSSNPD
jgi:hypothetical protein